MSKMRLSVGRFEYGIDEPDLVTVIEQVKSALENSTIAELVLLDGDRPVTVYLNGRTADAVIVDADRDPRPGEIS
jgi:hypothetical protein